MMEKKTIPNENAISILYVSTLKKSSQARCSQSRINTNKTPVNTPVMLHKQVMTIRARLVVTIVSECKGYSIAIYLSKFTHNKDTMDRMLVSVNVIPVEKQMVRARVSGIISSNANTANSGTMTNTPANKSAHVSDAKNNLVGVFRYLACFNTMRQNKLAPIPKIDKMENVRDLKILKATESFTSSVVFMFIVVVDILLSRSLSIQFVTTLP